MDTHKRRLLGSLAYASLPSANTKTAFCRAISRRFCLLPEGGGKKGNSKRRRAWHEADRRFQGYILLKKGAAVGYAGRRQDKIYDSRHGGAAADAGGRGRGAKSAGHASFPDNRTDGNRIFALSFGSDEGSPGVMKEGKGKPLLDATCGARTMWFPKDCPRAVYADNRVYSERNRFWGSTVGKNNDSLARIYEAGEDIRKRPKKNI